MVRAGQSAGTLLREGMPKSGEEVEGLEEPQAIPSKRARTKDTPRAEPSLPEAPGRAEAEGKKLSRLELGCREGHRAAKNLLIRVTVQAASTDSRGRVVRLCNDSAQVVVVERFIAFWRGSDVGSPGFERYLGRREGFCASELDVLPREATKPSFELARKREEGGELKQSGLLLFSQQGTSGFWVLAKRWSQISSWSN